MNIMKNGQEVDKLAFKDETTSANTICAVTGNTVAPTVWDSGYHSRIF